MLKLSVDRVFDKRGLQSVQTCIEIP